MQEIKPKAYVCLPWVSRINCIYNDGVIGTILWWSQFAESRPTAKHTFLILPWPPESEYLTAFSLFNNKKEFGAHACQQVIKIGFYKCHSRWCLTTLQSWWPGWQNFFVHWLSREDTSFPQAISLLHISKAFGNRVKCQSCILDPGLASFILTLKLHSAVKVPLNRQTRNGT